MTSVSFILAKLVPDAFELSTDYAKIRRRVAAFRRKNVRRRGNKGAEMCETPMNSLRKLRPV